MRVHREKLQLVTAGDFDIVDITADVEKALVNSGIQEGFALVYSPHTTCTVLLHEKETGLIADLQDALARLVPRDRYYRHDDWEIRTENLHPDDGFNAHSHLRQILAGSASECLPVGEGSLMLGTWQRVMVVELDRSREREILIQICGE